MKVLVTGAAGFLGGHLVDMLVERGDEVRALARPGEDTRHLETVSGVEIVQGDLTDVASLQPAVQGAQCLYNVAAKTGPWGLENDYRAANVQGLANLVHCALDAGIQRIVHTSSITAYGHHAQGIVTENSPFAVEDNPYSRSKIAGEKLLANLVRDQGAPVVIVRPGWIYGPRDWASFGRFVALIDAGKGFFIGTGANVVPLVYARDVAQGLIKAGNAGNEVIGRAYTLADDRRVTQAQYFNMIAAALGIAPVSLHLPYLPLYAAGRAAELLWQALGRRRAAPPPLSTYGVTLLGRDQFFSIARARNELGYAPVYDLESGVAAGVQWYLTARQGKREAPQELHPAPLSSLK